MPAPDGDVGLRSVCLEDADEIAGWGDDPVFCRAAGWSTAVSTSQRREHLRGLVQDPPPDLLRLAVTYEQQVVGYVDFAGSNAHHRELGYVVGPRSRWGQGLGGAAARAACDFGFGVLGLATIHAEVDAANARSIAILQGLGMRELARAHPSGRRRFLMSR